MAVRMFKCQTNIMTLACFGSDEISYNIDQYLHIENAHQKNCTLQRNLNFTTNVNKKTLVEPHDIDNLIDILNAAFE